MYSRMMQTLNATDSRYPNAQEQEEIMGYLTSVPKRMQAMRQVEQKELEMVNQAVAEMKKRYPNFANLHDRAWDKAVRDMQLILRYNVQGMLMDDPEMASEKLFFWFRTIVASVGMTPKFMHDTYTLLRDACKQKLPADAFQLLEPHLERTIEVLSDIPEPHRPAV